MDKINWCLKQNRGLELDEPNKRLASAYIRKAESSLETLKILEDKEWKIVAAYYTMYHSIYGLLRLIGIKCEIHTCTIEFVKTFLSDYFSKEECRFLENSLQARIYAQYYTNNEISDDIIQRMFQNAPEILAKCKSIISAITESKINSIRTKLKEIK